MMAALSDPVFFTIFLVVVSYYYPELVGPENKPLGKDELSESYDFIIVGAGSAGCVVANRLSEVTDWKIALLEAGGDESAISHTPFLYNYLFKTPMDWNYTTVKQNSACLVTDGVCAYPRGRVVGGCSSTNGMWYVRGNKKDYDELEEIGLHGWSYKDVLPYFLKSEDVKIDELSDSQYHGKGGPLTVQYSNFKLPLTEDLLKAGEEIGLIRGDYNGEYQSRMSRLQMTVNGPRRWSTSSAFLLKASRRPNVSLLKDAQVTQVLLDPVTKKALGVEYVRDNTKKTALVRKEVILSAGAINSPQLLMLSGIGHRDHLGELGIPLVQELPVGDNLQDHPMGNISFHLEDTREGRTGKPASNYKTIESILDYAMNKSGPLTAFSLETVMFINSMGELTSDPPNTVLFPHSFAYDEYYGNESILDFYASLFSPNSKGNVRLRSANPFDPPLIDPNYFSDPNDMDAMINALREILKVMNSQVMAKYSPKVKETSVCFQKFSWENEKALLECLVKYHSTTIFHPVGTAKMGLLNDSSAVVDERLKVKGIQGLRVIDASVFPKVPTGNTNAPTIMVAEKASDIIKRDYNVI